MRVQSNGKIRRTASEWDSLLEQYRSSGLSAAAFCRREKLSKNTFAKWQRRRARRVATPKVKPPAGFVECTPRPILEPASCLAAGEVELSLPGGAVLRWKL